MFVTVLFMKWWRQTVVHCWHSYCWHSPSHCSVLVVSILVVTRCAADWCWCNCPTNISSTEWPPDCSAPGVAKLKAVTFVVHCYQEWDLGAPLQSRDENGIHGMQAFHIACKAVQDICEPWEGDGSALLGHLQDDSRWFHTLWCDWLQLLISWHYFTLRKPFSVGGLTCLPEHAATLW
jgi:hypothetical protein